MTNGPPPANAAPHGTALRDAKLSLRRHLLARRDALDPESRIAAGTAIVGKLIALPSFVIARSVLLTLPFRSEWDTLPLVRDALATGRTVVVPRVNALTRMLELFAIADPACDIGVGHQGIPEPLPHCRALDLAAVDFVAGGRPVPKVWTQGDRRRT